MNNGFTVNGLQLDSVLVPRSYFNQSTQWAWGLNSSGQLGNNSIINQSSPVQTIASGLNWKQISCGKTMTGGIKTDGTLWTWGGNASTGQLGDNTTISKSSPVQTVAGGTNWRQLSVGLLFSLDTQGMCAAVKTDGTLWLWGKNNYGQLGDNTTGNKSSPVQTIAGATTWNKVSASGSHCGAIKTDGTLWMWGFNNGGQLGANDTTSRSSPIQTISSGTTWLFVATGAVITAAIKTDGTLWTWGINTLGQLGDNTTINKSSPVQTIASGSSWQQVSAGGSNNGGANPGHMMAIKTDGTLWTWGYNDSGQLGDNTTINKSSPIQTVAAGATWSQVSAGYYTSSATKTNGTLWTWGYNAFGQLGDNTTIRKSSPVQTISGGTNWSQVSTGYFTNSGLTFNYY